MEKYDNYKGSGIEWIGEIPSHWDESKIKYLSKESNSLFIDGDWIERKVIIEEGIRYITTGNIKVGYYSEQGSGFISEETFNNLNCTEIFEGDLVISRLNNPIGRACIIPNLNSRIVTSVDNVIFRPDSNVNKHFLLYLFSSKEYFEITELISRGATMQRISRGLYGNIKIPLPPLNEQTTIANYLDLKTSQIDHLIAKKEQFIKLLEEERVAVINQAVTKGLDPNVPMKDSGVEWLGEIPEHWEVSVLKYILTTTKGFAFKSEQFTEKGLPIVKASDIKNKSVRLDTTHYINEDIANEYTSVKLSTGDILISTVGSTPDVINSAVGQIGKVPKELNGALLNQNTVRLEVLNINKIQKDYIFFIIQNDNYRSHLNLHAHGTANQASLKLVDLLSYKLALPPLEEQVKIIDYNFKEDSRINNIISKTKQEIDLLKEYKTALISEVVTGKVDVRNEKLD